MRDLLTKITMTKQELEKKKLEMRKKSQANLKKYNAFSFWDNPEDDIYEEHYIKINVK